MKFGAWFCAMLLAVAAPARSEVPPTSTTNLFQPNGLDSHGRARLRIDRAALEIFRKSNGTHRVVLPLASGESLQLTLKKFDVLTPRSRFVRAGNSGVIQLNAPKLLHISGQIENEPGSHVFISLSERGAGSGFIARANGEWLQLGADRGEGNASNMIVHGDLPAIPGFEAVCGVPDEPITLSALAGPQGEPQPSGLRMIPVAVDADQKYCQMFDSEDDAVAYITQVIAAVSDIYRRDLNFKLVLEFVRIWPDGGEPFNANNLAGFRDHWIKNEDLTGLNLVHLFSGHHDMSYAGIAYLDNACDGFGFGISGFMLGGFPAPVDQPDLQNWDVVVVAHEMGHNLGAPHTHSLLPPVDNCANGADQRGTIMSYCHTRPGGLLNIDMRMHARNQENTLQANPHGNCLLYDCNDNNIDDADDLKSGASVDANLNGVPDECEDCNGDGIFNDVEIAAGASDVNLNGIPDQCEVDCNGNSSPDRFECSLSPSIDLNGNLIPDVCEADCDGNGVADHIDIENDTWPDIDRDSGPDVCQDCNGNGFADWIDIERQYNFYAGQLAGSVREYHALSGVPIQNVGLAISYDIAFGSDRQLYVANWGANKITRINLETNTVSDFVSPSSGGLVRPSSLAFGPDGNLYVAAQGNSSVIRFNGQSGAFMNVFVPAASGSLNMPWDIAFRPNGNLLVTSANNRVLEYDGVTGQFLSVFIDSPTLGGPRGLVMLPSGEWLVANRTSNLVNRYSSSGEFLGKFNDDFPLISPWGIVVGPNGNVYIGSNNSPVRIIEYKASSGQYLRSFVRGDTITNPTQFAFRPASPNDANNNNVPDDCDALPCKADIAPVAKINGTVDVDDLLLVLEQWGPCPDCTADIAPIELGGDNLVNVDDLLEIINQWGPCDS